MRSLILKTIKISSKEWNRKIKRYQNELMIYDKFNKKKKSIIKNCLRNNEKI